MGLDFLPPAQRTITVVVVGNSTAPVYDCAEVVDDGNPSNTGAETFVIVEGGVGSLTEPVKMWEANNNTGVPVGAYVTAWPTEAQENGAAGWRFWWEGAATALKVREVDLSPTVTNVSVLEFDQDDGLKVSQPAAGVARVDLEICDDVQYLPLRRTACIGLVPWVFRNDYSIRLVQEDQKLCIKVAPGNEYPEYAVDCCPCDSGTGTGTGCVPGDCAACDDPPRWWETIASGFSGLCEAFNGLWRLENTGECEWSAGAFLGGSEVTVTLTIGGDGAVTLVFELTAGGVVVASASYTADLNFDECDGDCCQALEFELDECAGCEGDVTDEECPVCEGDTPGKFSIIFPEMTGCFSTLSGQEFTLDAFGPCLWLHISVPGVNMSLTLSEGNGFLTISPTDGAGESLGFINCIVPSNDPETGGFNCCAQMTANVSDAGCADGSAAPTLPPWFILYPSCDPGDPPGSGEGCPESLAAVPDCCDGITDCDSGTGTGTPCDCDGHVISEHLIAGFSNGGGMACAFGGASLTWDPNNNWWAGFGRVGDCGNPGGAGVGLTIRVKCTHTCGSGWDVEIIADAACFVGNDFCFSEDQCTPTMRLSYDLPWFNTAECGGTTMASALRITIVEV